MEDPRLLSEQRNIQHAIIGEVMTSLPEILLSLTKARLSSLASVNGISGRSKMKKEELADALVQYLVDPEHLKSIVLVTDADEWALLESLLSGPSIQDNSLPYGQYAYFLNHGLVFSYFTESKLYIIMPDEIKAAAAQINLTELKKEHNQGQMVYQYILAASQLYGVIHPNKLIEIYNAQNPDKLTEQELLKHVGELMERGQGITQHDGYIVNSYLVNDLGETEIANLLDSAKDKPYYVPEREELLRYADETYFEMTSQLSALQDYVLKELCKDQETVDYLIDDVQLACAKGSSIQDLIYEFESRKINFKTPLQAQQTIQLLTEIYNNTRMWSNNGHTLVELLALNEGNEAIGSKPSLLTLVDGSKANSVPKVGRNDPCPCGSGLKYKKCHGK